jgi:RNA polymerase sigma-70 factor (ECF subfamily)
MPDGQPDEELHRRFVHGDRDAFERLFRRYEHEVSRWIRRIVRDPAAAEDALVDAFWRAYRSRARFDPARSFGAWLRRIATNAALDALKRAPKERASLDDVPLRVAQPPAAIADPGLSQAIAGAFRGLPPKLRLVATLALIEERPHEEIAEALDVPIGTVKSRLFRATRLLRRELARVGVHT